MSIQPVIGMLHKLGMTVRTEVFLVTPIAVLSIFLCLTAMYIRPVQRVLTPYLMAIRTITLLVAGIASRSILFSLNVMYFEPVVCMWFGAGMAAIAEVLMMTSRTGILVLFNV